MTDAGSAFYGWNGFNKFQKLMTDEYGVDQIKASSPRSNGKIENVNKQIEKEVLNVDRYASLEEAGEAIHQWIRFYNFERTHMGLPTGMVPADRFLPGWNESSASAGRVEARAWSDILSFVQGKIKRVG
jgi:transposase InsO family protein